VHHVTIRGNNRQPVFLDSADRQRYCQELIRCHREFSCRLLAYALMPNHIHLVLQDEQGQLSRYMQALNARSTHSFNHRHQRVGHLYQGRFYAKLVGRDAYLLEVTRYVHLNPVRAKLVRHPEDFPWSSYRVYAGLEPLRPELVDSRFVWSMMTAATDHQPSRYRHFVEQMTAQQFPAWERKLRRLDVIGSARFAAQLRKCQTLIPAQQVSDT
jgi:REP element-mobilizing transposase RayT